MSTSVKIRVEAILRDTQNAVLVETVDGRQVWLPYSAVDLITRSSQPTVTVERWLAEKEDLLDAEV
jgi:hypothetical protein